MIKKIYAYIIWSLSKILFFEVKKSKYSKIRIVNWILFGNEKLRTNYDLNSNSIVFDLGGYKGDFVDSIYSIYKCKVFVFEPFSSYFNIIVNRFSSEESIKIFNYGLSNKNSIEKLYISEEGSSTINKLSTDFEEIKLVNFFEFINDNKIEKIDLIKINIEGGEYDLLDAIVENPFINKISNLQIQFHDFVPDAELRMNKIKSQLDQTHFLTYEYPFIWENWRKR
jgi:FkbM family methyltransferase